MNFPVAEIQGKYSYTQQNEKHSLQLGSTAYLDDVTAGAGEFLVLPRSHIYMNYAFKARWNDDNRRRVKFVRKILSRVIQPKMIAGKAGDVIFWHHRLLHGRNVNSSRRIRYAAVCDFSSKALVDQKTSIPPQNTFDMQRPSINMWRDWAV